MLAALGTNTQEVASGRSRILELWNRSIGELRLRDGSRIFCDGADDGAYRIQGKNLPGVWGDEISLWRRWETAWNESIGFALRKGDARLIATGTPKADMPARALVRRLLEDPAVVVRRLRTTDNEENLSPAFLEAVKLQAGGAASGSRSSRENCSTTSRERSGDAPGSKMRASTMRPG